MVKRCEWCWTEGCWNHEARRSFPLGEPTFVLLGPAPPDRYAEEREALIPRAVWMADSAVGRRPARHRRDWEDRWSRAFHAAMEYLWRTGE